MATDRQKLVIQLLGEGSSMNEIVAKVTNGGDNNAEVVTDDGTEIKYAHKKGEASAKNLVRATRAVLNALAEMGQISPLPKHEVEKMSPEEKKAKAKDRREAKKAAEAADKVELAALREKAEKKTKKSK